jgi:hypothetical protein
MLQKATRFVNRFLRSLETNRVYDPGSFNFFKQRKDKGVRDAAHDKHDLFKALDK